jgi:hypothetical protein
MQYYNYEKAVKEDVIDYIKENYDIEETCAPDFDEEDFAEKLDEDLWAEDSVTGNGSGSYTFDTLKAAEYLVTNFDLLAEALEEFGSDIKYLKKGAEACDAAIRCYVLRSAIGQAIEELRDEGWFTPVDED